LKVLLDEMLSGLKPFLKLLGWEAFTVQEAGLKGAEDERVVRYAKDHGMVLVTQEQRVADLASLIGVPSVVVSLAEVAKVVDERLRRLSSAREVKAEELKG
jgi:predicted nuclease of predicted toxin-antitoxin system